MDCQQQQQLIAWFEDVCSNQLSVNPRAATDTLVEFRDSAGAMESCKCILQCNSLSPASKFHAASILQYLIVKLWTKLSHEDKLYYKTLLWSLIQVNHTLPLFVVNKFIQSYCMMWKLEWAVESVDKSLLFTHIMTLCKNPTGDPASIRIGSMILKALLEEFNCKTSVEVGLSLAFHQLARVAFQNFGLDESLQIGISNITVSLAMSHAVLTSQNESNAILVCGALYESCKLLQEIIHWELNTDNLMTIKGNTSKETESVDQLQAYCLPRKWSVHIMQPKLLGDIFDIYERLYVLLHTTFVPHSAAFVSSTSDAQVHAFMNAMSELRMILISLASITGPFFESENEKIYFAEFILSKSIVLLDRACAYNAGNSVVCDTLRSKECEHFSTIIYRILSNYQMPTVVQLPVFDKMMTSLGYTTFILSKEISQEAAKHLTALFAGSSVASFGDLDLFNSWKGELLMLLLDAWRNVMDDSMMRKSSEIEETDDQIALNVEVKRKLISTSHDLFAQLFECMYNYILCESISCNDDEEDEDNEAIDSKKMDELIAGICTIGRVNFVTAINFVTNTLAQSISTCNSLAQQNLSNNNGYQRECLRQLETIRVCLLFASHLCYDDFNTASSETPVVPTLVLDDCLVTAPEVHIAAFHSLIVQVSLALDMQIFFWNSSLSSHPLCSPYILRWIVLFLQHYLYRYVDTKTTLYNSRVVSKLSHLFLMHSQVSSDKDDAFHNIIDKSFNAVFYIARYLPLETELVKELGELVIVVAKASGSKRGDYLLSLPGISSLFALVTSNRTEVGTSHFNTDGLVAMYKGLTYLAVKCKSETMLVQLCAAIRSQVEALANALQAGQAADHHKGNLEAAMACLLGISSCPKSAVSNIEKHVHQLFNTCLPIIIWCVFKYSVHDDLINLCLSLLRNYSDAHLAILDPLSLSALYSCSLKSMELFASILQKFHDFSSISVGATLEEKISFRNDTVFNMLDLLNNLSLKELSLDDDSSDVVLADAMDMTVQLFGAMYRTIALCDVLIMGIELLVPVISADLLRNFPKTCDRYFSLIRFVASSYEQNLMVKVNQTETGNDFLNKIIQHLLWGASAVDSSSANIALHAIQVLASSHINNVRKGGGGYGATADKVTLPGAMDVLVEMIIFPAKFEYGISSDRTDACASTLLTLMSIDINHFYSYAKNLIAQQNQVYHMQLLQSFEKLITQDHIDVSSLDRANKEKFKKNLREFIVEVRSLVMFH